MPPVGPNTRFLLAQPFLGETARSLEDRGARYTYPCEHGALEAAFVLDRSGKIVDSRSGAAGIPAPEALQSTAEAVVASLPWSEPTPRPFTHNLDGAAVTAMGKCELVRPWVTGREEALFHVMCEHGDAGVDAGLLVERGGRVGVVGVGGQGSVERRPGVAGRVEQEHQRLLEALSGRAAQDLEAGERCELGVAAVVEQLAEGLAALPLGPVVRGDDEHEPGLLRAVFTAGEAVVGVRDLDREVAEVDLAVAPVEAKRARQPYREGRRARAESDRCEELASMHVWLRG